MKGYLWQYSEWVNRKNSAGNVGVNIVAGKQQTIKPILMVLRTIAGNDTGGTSLTSVYYSTEFHASRGYLLEEELTEDVFLPNEDYLSSWKGVNLENVFLMGGDKIVMFRNYIASTGSILVEFRGILSTYALPSITYYDATNNESHLREFNDIIGVIE